jgi:CYTH domain-containing protein
MIDRAPGQGRYARLEREQRWVLRERPADVLGPPVSIVDLYLAGTTLRLRRMESETTVVCKLGQKVRADPSSPARAMVTNLYLTEPEFATFLVLGGDQIAKVRWRWPEGGRSLVVDQFEGPLDGLLLAEVELDAGATWQHDPPLAVADVTDDDRFSGGRLSRTTSEQLQLLLADFLA